MFHPVYLAIYLPIHDYALDNRGGPPKAAPTVVEAAESRLHNGGWGGKWLDIMDETFLKLSELFHNCYPAIYLPTHCCGGGLRPPPYNVLKLSEWFHQFNPAIYRSLDIRSHLVGAFGVWTSQNARP